jgi:hypothetical protein
MAILVNLFRRQHNFIAFNPVAKGVVKMQNHFYQNKGNKKTYAQFNQVFDYAFKH